VELSLHLDLLAVYLWHWGNNLKSPSHHYFRPTQRNRRKRCLDPT
jgi:hypothetical protein